MSDSIKKLPLYSTICLLILLIFMNINVAHAATYIKDCSVTLNPTSFEYDGKAKEPTVTVKYGNVTLKEGTDYTTYFFNNINVGTAKVVLLGSGNYSGSKTIEYSIVKKDSTQPENHQTQTISTTAAKYQLGINKYIWMKPSVTSGLPMTFETSNKNVATVDDKGVLKGIKKGSCTITIKQAGDSKWNPVTKQISVAVEANYGGESNYPDTSGNTPVEPTEPTKKNQTITANNVYDVKVGKSVNLNAKTNSGLPLSYKTNDSKTAVVNANGVVTGKKVGTAVITISQAGNDTWNSAKKNVTINVKTADIPKSTADTYTIVYHGGSNIGMSDVSPTKTYKETVKINKSHKLMQNKFKKKGYKFVGWARESGKANKNGKKHIEQFSNINMKHFQLGKIATTSKTPSGKKKELTNGRTVKNLVKAGETIHLYAVWKGNGPEAAVDWGKIIASDDNFRYGGYDYSSSKWTSRKGNRNHRIGCYFCETNRKEPHGNYGAGKSSKKWNVNKSWSQQSLSQKYDKTWCCNPFIVACYTHGANEKLKCGGGSMSYGSWTEHTGNGKFKKVGKKSESKYKVGDVFFTGGHVYMYAGKNSKGKIMSLEAASGNWSKNSIVYHQKSVNRSGLKGVVRYYPKN